MTTQTIVQGVSPASGIKALLDTLYDVKFSKHTPLIVVLLSAVYTVHRTQHYLNTAFHLDVWVSWPTAVFIELIVLAAAASVYIALRAVYIAELWQQDQARAQVGVYVTMTILASAFVALLAMAFADGYATTGAWLPTFIVSLVQVVQMLLICSFIIAADLDERKKLRTLHTADQQEQQAARARLDEARARKERDAKQALSNSCPYCERALLPNNRARHMASCAARPRTV